MANNDLTAKVRITGDGKELSAALDRAEGELHDFDKVGSQIRLLETAVADVETFKEGLGAARARAQQLKAALSEAYASGAEAPQLKKLNTDLAAAEREAVKAAEALKRGEIAVRQLDLASTKTGISLHNLAQKKAELAAETAKVSARIGDLKGKLEATAIAERNMAAGADAVKNAFATLNIRSAEKIKADIEAVNQALVRLAGNSKVSGADFDRAYAAAQVRIAALRAELAGVEASAGKTTTAVTGMGASLAALAPALGGLAVGQEFVRANVAAESLERTLVQLTGSAESAAAETDYLKTTANRLGLEVNTTSRAYISLMAAAKGTALEGAGQRQIFEAVAGAMSKLGKSSADTEGALQAIAQMMGKGTVSMEEMRQQLAERLPGAMQAAADATGVTVGELTEMISSGQVLAGDLLPKLADGLTKMYGTAGQAEGSVAAWNRLKNAVNETFVFVGNSGVWTGLVAVLGQAAIAVRGLSGGFELLGKIAGISLGAIVAFDFKHPIDSVRNWKNAVAEAGDEIQKKLDKAKAAAEGSGAAQVKLAEQGRQAAEAAKAQGVSWLAVVNAYAKVNAASAEAVTQSVKSAAARAEEGKASVALAGAFGTETEKRTAALNAAKNDAAALATVAQARRIEAEVASSNAIALQEAAKADTVLTEEKRKAIKAAEDSAVAKRAEADQATAAALAAQQHAAALATETEMLKDNSGRLVELKAAADAAAVALENMRQLKAQGIATDQQVKDAEIAAAQAKALYRDAVNDQTKAIEYNARIKQSEMDLQSAGLKLQIEQARSMAEVAKAYGDETTAASYLLQVKQLEIELAELSGRAKRAEGEAALQMVAAKRAELAASGELTAAKEAELRAQELGAQVKLKEGEIAAETADRMRQLAAATADYTGVTGPAADGTNVLAGSLNNGADSADRMAQSLQRLKQEQQNVGGGGSGGSDGVRTVTTSPVGQVDTTKADFTETIYRRGATIEEQKLAQKYVGELFKRNLATMLTGNLGNADNAERLRKIATNDAVDKAIAAARKEIATGQATDLGVSVDDLIARNKGRTPIRSLDDMIGRIKNAGNEAKAQQVFRVDLRTDGGKRSVNVASERDASDLITTLKELQGRAA